MNSSIKSTFILRFLTATAILLLALFAVACGSDVDDVSTDPGVAGTDGESQQGETGTNNSSPPVVDGNGYGYNNGGYYDEYGDADLAEGYAPRDDDHIDFGENEFIETQDENTSTFSIDINTASYTIARRDLLDNRLPRPESVRTEEFINFFRFDYPEPLEDPFSVNMELAPSHYGSDDETDRHLLRIGMKGKDVSIDEMKPTNLVFLADVSGSMNRDDRMPLAKKSMHVALEYLRDTDTVAMQTYASGTETVLEPTPVSERGEIEAAIDSLVAQGGTNGEGGIRAAYDLAEDAFIEGGNNRVIILTDGDFNVGKVGDDLVEMVKGYRDREISLTSVGYGHGGYGDATMERIAREGNGNYFYIDTEDEAYRVFGSELPSTVEVIAQDVRTQVEFNEEAIERYRLIGYEKRVMDNEEFDDEDTNAGEIGPGHTVTAFYEMELTENAEESGHVAEVRIRHREQYGEDTKKQIQQIKYSQIHDEFDDASDGFRFAASVAQFAGALRESQFIDEPDFDDIHDVAEGATYDDYSEQQEFLELVNIARDLWED